MNIALWIAQGVLAAMFAMAGIQKSTMSIEALLKGGMNWASRFPLPMVRFIGVVELLGALGLILPWLLNIAPILTPVAACGLALLQLLALFHHTKHKESKAIVFNTVLLSLSVFVAYGRSHYF